ncbi:MAG: hypothetical protein Crog4KO_20890 [Crocinitomicaceae bacterium]
MKTVFLVLALCGISISRAQNYTSYLTGNTSDIVTAPTGGICLMGGATEEDEAMKWFLNRADGGDILVLRASGSDGYNDYLYNQLGVSVNSVETIVFNDASASNEAYIQQKIAQAEAIWFAGGDQWDYISYWSGTPIQTEINQSISQGTVVGGTSAGMAILGGFYFSAENGTITSAKTLSNPYDNNATVGTSPFLQSSSYLEETITDTHYDNPDRKGRHVVFLARVLADSGVSATGIACDEYTAVCIDENGLARIFGQHPTYDDNAYFLQVNCEIQNPAPEVCSTGTPLTWNHNGSAVKVYAVKGTLAGTNTFDLSDWQTGSGGEWQDWSVNNGTLSESPGAAPDCNSVSLEETVEENNISIVPNPASEFIEIQVALKDSYVLSILSAEGKLIDVVSNNKGTCTYNVSNLNSGVYLVSILFADGTIAQNKILVD